MTTSFSTSGEALEAQFGRRVAGRLSAGTEALPHDIGERLRVARAQALARRRLPARAAPVLVDAGGTATLGNAWWARLAAVLPLIALVAGLISISAWQEDQRASELAEVDAALLTDDLPPAAYTDSGFAQFLKSEAAANR